MPDLWLPRTGSGAALRRQIRRGNRDVAVAIDQQPLGVVDGVGAWLAPVQVRGRNPFGITGGAFSGGPAGWSQHSVVGPAGEREIVDVGGVAVRIVGDMVHFAVEPGQVASGCRAAAVLGVQDNSLAG